MTQPFIQVKQVSKVFPATKALSDVSLDFFRGEILGIIGENGAGKSTLMKILAGIYHPTEGELAVEGVTGCITDIRSSVAHGVAIIHQEQSGINDLTVAENIFLGREPHRGPMIDFPKMVELTRAALEQVGATFHPDAMYKSLSLAQRQLVEIARALSQNATLLILDEPTSVLGEADSEKLFELLDTLRERGVGMVYISHRLHEIERLCDRIAVLRDGELVGIYPGRTKSPTELASLMVGRELSDFFPPKVSSPTEEVVLEIDNLRQSGTDEGVSFALHRGEILGLAGLIGAGRTEVAEMIFGVRNGEGQVKIKGQSYDRRTPERSKRNGIVYVSEDRKELSLHLGISIVSNITLPNLKNHQSHGIIQAAAERATAEEWQKKLDIRAGDLTMSVGNLSGGNQQKVALAKWLDAEPAVFIIDEPTRGVDVGAKREIYQVVCDLAAQGLAVLLISSELTEIIGLCHRALVVRDGAVVGELKGDQITEPAMIKLAAGVQAS